MRSALFALAAVAGIISPGIGHTAELGRKVISTPAAPNAIGPYSQAIRAGNTLYVSGEIAIDPTTNRVMADASIEDQTRRALENIKAILEADGLTMEDIVSTTVFLSDINEFDKMNQVYATFFGKAPPARATVQVARLARDVKIEISTIAVVP